MTTSKKLPQDRLLPMLTFDNHQPPDPELIADCVHCGFCLPTCPTYLLWGEEMDSPRGRIQLMKMVSEGQIGLNETFTRHIDLCLGCMACVTACPSGVQYNKLIEATRSQVDRHTHRSLLDRLFRSLLFSLFPHPARLRALVPLLWLYQKSGIKWLLRSKKVSRLLPERVQGMESVMPPVRLWHAGEGHAGEGYAGEGHAGGGHAGEGHPGEASSPLRYGIGVLFSRPKVLARARGPRRRRVGLLTGCVQRVFFDPVNAATIRVLVAEGCDVVMPRTQGCCGALHVHAGREDEGLSYARRLIDAFEFWSVDTVVVNAAGCGSTLKEYGYLLRNDPVYAERAEAFSASVRDILELLAELEPVAPRHPVPLRVAYHDACHLAHAQNIRRQPREVLRAIPGIELLDVPEAEICCGSAGIYNLVEPGPARELGDRKASNILSTRPDVIATANPGCLLQIRAALERAGSPVGTLHPVELVDASIRGVMPSVF